MWRTLWYGLAVSLLLPLSASTEGVNYVQSFSLHVSAYEDSGETLIITAEHELCKGCDSSIVADFSTCKGELCAEKFTAWKTDLEDAIKQGKPVRMSRVDWNLNDQTLRIRPELPGTTIVAFEGVLPSNVADIDLVMEGETSCAITDAACNRCVPNLDSRLRSIVEQPHHVSKLHQGTARHAGYPGTLGGGHIQGFIRLPGPTSTTAPRFYTTVNRPSSGWLTEFRMTSYSTAYDRNRGRLGSNVRTHGVGNEMDARAKYADRGWDDWDVYGNHPGGMQGIGTDYLIMAHEDKSASEAGFQLFDANNKILHQEQIFPAMLGAGSAGITRLASGYYLISLYTDAGNDGNLMLLHSSSKSLQVSQTWHRLSAAFVRNADAASHDMYEQSHLITECGTGHIYLVGMGGGEGTFPGFNDDQHLYWHRLDFHRIRARERFTGSDYEIDLVYGAGERAETDPEMFNCYGINENEGSPCQDPARVDPGWVFNDASGQKTFEPFKPGDFAIGFRWGGSLYVDHEGYPHAYMIYRQEQNDETKFMEFFNTANMALGPSASYAHIFNHPNCTGKSVVMDLDFVTQVENLGNWNGMGLGHDGCVTFYGASDEAITVEDSSGDDSEHVIGNGHLSVESGSGGGGWHAVKLESPNTCNRGYGPRVCRPGELRLFSGEDPCTCRDSSGQRGSWYDTCARGCMGWNTRSSCEDPTGTCPEPK